MPWKVERSGQCPASQPWGALKEDGGLGGCDETEEAEKRQLAALNASEERSRDRRTAGAVEERTAGGVAVDGRKIRGLVPYSVESRGLGGWKEIIEPTAFKDTDV